MDWATKAHGGGEEGGDLVEVHGGRAAAAVEVVKVESVERD